MKENLKGCLVWIVGFLIITFIGASLGFINSESLKGIDLFAKIKEEAYNEGFIDGRAEGREENVYENGRSYDNGYKVGYEAGFADGAKDSSSAYEDGYIDGYTKGYSEGKAAGTSSGTQSSDSSVTSSGSGTFTGSGGNTYYGPVAEECDYVLNKSTKKFHEPTCPSATNIKQKNREYFTGTREEVIARGYEPCGRCDP